MNYKNRIGFFRSDMVVFFMYERYDLSFHFI